MDLNLFVQLVTAILRDEFNGTIIVEDNRINVLFGDGTQYLLTVEKCERAEQADRRND